MAVGRTLVIVLSAAVVLLSIPHASFAQTTVGTGSIVGIVSDPAGAVISSAKVTITDVANGQLINLIANSSGSFLPPTYAARRW